MSDLTVARRYAQALYNEAEREALVAKVDEDMDVVQGSLEGSRELVTFFRSPIISRDKKASVIRQLFEKRLQPVTFRFLMLLVSKQREDLFPTMVGAYRDLRDSQLGVTEAIVRTAQPLQDKEVERLQQSLEKKVDGKVRLRVLVEPDLIGGVVIRLGDTVYDGSVRHQLVALRERLVERGSFAPAALSGPMNHAS